jgi:SAM-dependent methyltransferase
MNTSLIMNAPQQKFETLRSVLTEVGFTPEGVLNAIGVKDSASIKESDILLLMQRTKTGTPLDTLIRLFLMEVPVEVSALQLAIEPMGIVEWIEMELIEIQGESVVAKMKLFPFQDMVIAYDVPRRLLTGEGGDYVMGAGGSSLTLANLTIRRPVGLTLDLGTGCGFQAFLAARHSDRVVAVDRNPRAVAIAAFNARLNGLANVECREGDLFGPVEGMTFDLIVSNPPFVISPESRYIYRDSGMAGDEICQRIVREAPHFLSEGGFCHILCNWAEYGNQDWRERLREWFDGSGCDVWVMRNQTRDVATYAATWIRHTEKLETEHLEERFDEWLEYYRKHGIEQVGGGVITMRRRSRGNNWFRADDGIETMLGPCGDQILRGFEIQDFLECSVDNATLLGSVFLLSPEVRLVQQKMPCGNEWVLEVAELHLSRGLSYRGEIDPFMERLLIGCDGSRPLEDLAGEMAVSLGEERERVITAVCGMVRHLVSRGFLLPPETSDDGETHMRDSS